ncbi:phytanoyl-CoA dioxygenase family protein [Caulifigura coniformis]|nr:phytanoyl-CoA dioxygenase family protein [Caulifigura coniformis]
MPDRTLIDDYRRNGVIVVPGLLSSLELQDVRRRIEGYQGDRLKDLPAGDFTLEPDGKTVRNLWRMEQHDPFFLEFAGQSRFLDLVGPLVNGEPVLVGVETFNKPALVGSAVPPHQDNAYFCQSPADVLTVWIAIDPATPENGAVEYLLGSHGGLRPHRPSGVKGNSIGLVETPRDEFPRFLGTIDAGDALIHHAQTIHFSSSNRSPDSRLSLILVYRGKHTATDADLKERYVNAFRMTNA